MMYNLYIATLILLSSSSLFGNQYQKYGLHFYPFSPNNITNTSNIIIDEGIKINPNDSVKITFDFSINQKVTFGNILHITFNDKKPIQLLSVPVKKGGKIVLNYLDKSFTLISIPDLNLQKKWDNIQFHINSKKREIKVLYLSKEWTLPFNEDLPSNLNINFGEIDTQTYKDKESSVFDLKDLKVYTNNKEYHWVLDQITGSKSFDKNHNKSISIKNPNWIIKKRYQWDKICSLELDDVSGIDFNPKKDMVFISYNENTLYYKLNSGNIIHNKETIPREKKKYNQLLIINSSKRWLDIEGGVFTTLSNIPSSEISKINENKNHSLYSNYSKFYDVDTKSLWVFGGYGDHTYRNSFLKFQLNKEKELISFSGDTIEPRYLSSIGHHDNKYYLYGGYGQKEGKQEKGAKHYYDFYEIDIHSKKVSELLSFDLDSFPSTPVPNLFIDSSMQSFKTLLYDNKKNQSSLRLYEFDIEKKTVTPVSDTIPYFFHDVNSYANIYYSKKSKKWLAVTMYRNEFLKYVVSIYTILSPTLNTAEKVNFDKQVALGSKTHTSFVITIASLLLAALLIIILLFIKRKKIKEKQKTNNTSPIISNEIKQEKDSFPIRVLGGFRVYDKNNSKITSEFSPILKELFLYLYFHSRDNNLGVTSKQIEEIIWPDKEGKSVKNNRSVNINRLRKILELLQNLELNYNKSYWKLTIEDKYTLSDHNQAYHLLTLIKANNTSTLDRKNLLKSLLPILSKGTVLPNTNYHWLDDFKSSFSNEVIDTLLSINETLGQEDNELKLQLADIILIYDRMSEEGIHIKCVIYNENGKQSLARSIFDAFTKEYQEIHNIEFEQGFDFFVSSE